MSGHRWSRVEMLEPRRLFNTTGWVDTINNPFMPMVAGMTWVYKGFEDGEPVKDRIVVQSYTKKVMGVTCTVVLDRVYTSGTKAQLWELPTSAHTKGLQDHRITYTRRVLSLFNRGLVRSDRGK